MNFGTIQVADIFVGALNATEAYFGTEKVWEKSAPPTANWLCFTAEEANSTVRMSRFGSAPTVSLEYSTDGATWSPFVVGTTTVTLANIGDYVYVRATSAGNTKMSSSSSNYNQFVMTGKIAASGNVDTLLDQNGNATLASYCYNHMFQNCRSLTTAPTLPATTLASNCYTSMFLGCSSLTTTPSLPATTLANNCYQEMFRDCSSLTSAPSLPVTTLANNCYYGMFQNCRSLTTAPTLPATTIVKFCYYGMFQGCTSLTTAPELPATTLAIQCYTNMFYGCTSLTTAPTLSATTLADSCYYNMFYGCTSLTTAPELPATTLVSSCYSYMFNGCTSLTSAPELPATTLSSGCYNSMFNGCSNLSSITLGYTGNFADAPSKAFTNWVSGVASSGTFYYNGSDTTTGVSAIPVGWTIVSSHTKVKYTAASGLPDW